MKNKFLLLMIAVSIVSACRSYRPTDFDFIKSIDDPLDTSQKPIYITSTIPIDSANSNQIIYDIFRIEIDKYPDTVKLYTRVYDSLGRFITQMAKPYKKSEENYFVRLRETLGKVYNTRDVEVPDFNVREFGALDSIPYNIVLTVDYSGSMDPIMGAIHQGAEIFVKLKFPFDQIAIATFNKDFDVKVPFSRDTSTILNLFRAKRKQGFGLFSGIREAVFNSIELFDGTDRTTPRVLVLFTDGDENYSKKEVGEIIKAAKERNVNIFCVAFGYTKDEEMKMLAGYTGGKFYKVYSREQMINVFRDIYNSLRYYYLVTYKPPKYWGWHTVFSYLNLPNRSDSLIAMGEYDTSDLWKDVGDEFVRPILFDFNKWDLKQDAIPIIEEIVDAMLTRPRLRLEIQGHTDNVGTQEYNLQLSENRAKAVYDAIVARGVEPSRLRYRGFGFAKPVASNATEEGRAKNRRTQFVVLAR
ncbi:MAG: OmpA family protein [Bacteroidota bacterium]